jgi:hypothetical protein
MNLLEIEVCHFGRKGIVGDVEDQIENNYNKLESVEGSYGSDLSLQLPHQAWRG